VSHLLVLPFPAQTSSPLTASPGSDEAQRLAQSWPVESYAQHPAALHEEFGAAEEALVIDERANLSPSQMVERKLLGLLKSRPLPVSQLMTRPARGRVDAV